MFGSVLPEDAQTALALLGEKKPFSAGTYLAGGSALALYLGHRKSVDFDFFTPTEFDPIKLSADLAVIGNFEEEVAKGITLIGKFQGVKLSCFHYNYPLLAIPDSYLNIDVADQRDIAAMKLVAITDRGTKKDFIDIYTLAHHNFPLEEMFVFYDKKYHLLETNRYTIIKALNYFDEADTTDMPEMLITLTWEEVKEFFIAESMRLAKKYLE